jgi:TPR repeat protein
MSKALRISFQEPKTPQIRYGITPKKSTRAAYPILLCLVVLVGGASLAAWCRSDYSLEERAARGDARAQYMLGKRYFDGAMSTHDYEVAARLIRKSAEQGDVRAETGLGLLYENGLGVQKNYGEALRWLRRAANQGHAVAQNELGVMYAKGRGVQKDLSEAVKWCRLAASQGSNIAKKNLQLAQVANAKVIAQLATSENKVYQGARIQKIESDGVTVSFLPAHGGMGLAKLKMENLPSELRQLCKYATKEGADSDSAYSHIGSVATTL